jgi:hypothetical protein
MQELVGRLTALDPEASETLKVVGYFDALIASGVGLDGLLRAAAALSGAAAGAERRGRVSRFDPTGRRLGDAAVIIRSPERSGSTFRVWLEREGALHVNDEMVVERLTLAVELREARKGPASGLDVALDPSTPISDRAAALARLRVGTETRIRLVATIVSDRFPERHLRSCPPVSACCVRPSMCRGRCRRPGARAWVRGCGPTTRRSPGTAR